MFPLMLIVFGQCSKPKPANKTVAPAVTSGRPGAVGFTLEGDRHARIIKVRNPWQSADKVEMTYILSDTLEASFFDGNQFHIKTPVQRVVCLSTTHIGFIGFLDRLHTIYGISGKNYVVNESVRHRINSGEVGDVGFDESLNYELIVKLKPDVVFAYGVSGAVTATVQKLNELGIPVVLIAEYLEEEPLAKLEWVKVFGAFYGLEKEASLKFDSVSASYRRMAEKASHISQKPSVLLGLPWSGTWYISGGKSYIARLVGDAGGTYLFSGLDFRDSRPLSLEKVYETALKADIWINAGDAGRLADIDAVDARFADLPVRREGLVYNNNKWMGSAGGNAFYETGVVEPDIILSDLISVFHPHLLPSHQLKYYKKLH
jgi:iron complex transport system substrate-binding protein